MSNREFDGTVLNPSGREISVPYWVFKRLKQLHLLERDRTSGLRRIQSRIFGLMPLWIGADFRPDRGVIALNPDVAGCRPHDSGYASAFLRVLGDDCSGMANPVIDRGMQEDLDHIRLSDEFHKQQVVEAIKAIKTKRRKH